MGVFVTPMIDLGVETGIYASGDALGEKNSIRVPEHGLITSLVVTDRDSENVEFNVVLYSADIAGTTDNAAFAPTDAENNTCVGIITVSGSDYKAFSTNSVASVNSLALGYWAPASVLYFQCVVRATPTYTAATDLSIRFGIVH
jgi:hypothetical protein